MEICTFMICGRPPSPHGSGTVLFRPPELFQKQKLSVLNQNETKFWQVIQMVLWRTVLKISPQNKTGSWKFKSSLNLTYFLHVLSFGTYVTLGRRFLSIRLGTLFEVNRENKKENVLVSRRLWDTIFSPRISTTIWSSESTHQKGKALVW